MLTYHIAPQEIASHSVWKNNKVTCLMQCSLPSADGYHHPFPLIEYLCHR